jgi:hypothetical protein
MSSEASSQVTLPDEVANSVLAFHQETVGASDLTIVGDRPETWPDACLGLAKPDELCAAMLVDGWMVTLSDGQQEWHYRTDATGDRIRLERDPTRSSQLQ